MEDAGASNLLSFQGNWEISFVLETIYNLLGYITNFNFRVSVEFSCG